MVVKLVAANSEKEQQVPRSRLRKFARRYLPDWLRLGIREYQKRLKWPQKEREWRRYREAGKTIVHVLHIQKTGGTAIREALTQVQHPELHLVFHGHGVRLAEIPRGDKVIFFLRDPIARFESGFFSRLTEGRPRYDAPWTGGEINAFRKFHNPEELAIGLSAEDNRMRGFAKSAMRTIRHVNTHLSDWLGSIDYLRSREDDILFVGYQETLAADFQKLKREINLDDSVELPEDDFSAYRRSDGTKSVGLSDQARRNLQKWYAADYDFVEFCRTFAARGR